MTSLSVVGRTGAQAPLLLLTATLFLTTPLGAQSQATSPTINSLPSREFGQPLLVNPLNSGAPNLVEGRELYLPTELAYDPVASVLYVADTRNNRVLAWTNPQSLSKGNPASFVIGQRDLTATIQQGPGGGQPTGFNNPASVVVDSTGNLYVLDATNNRILMFQTPAAPPGGGSRGGNLIPALVIGQNSVSSGSQPNQNGPASSSTLNLQYGGSMAFDSQNNLWVADAGNNRVLRFPSSALIPNAVAPQADIVLGQGNKNCTGSPFACTNGTNTPTDLTAFGRPLGLTFDGAGNLYVSDQLGRVLFFQGPSTTFTNFTYATRVLGIPPTVPQGQPPLAIPNGYTMSAPGGLFSDGSSLYVCDIGNNRILHFAPPSSWAPATTTAPSPAAIAAIGQASLNSGKPNKGQVAPDGSTLFNPTKGIFPFLASGNGEMWIADSSNHRILSLPSTGSGSFGPATRVLGQNDFGYNAPNLVEGREVFFLNNNSPGGAMIVDQQSNPPHLYVADTYNNRILGFRDVRTVGTDARTVLTQKADIVIGQPDLFNAIVNYPNGNVGTTLTPNATGLNQPSGLALDASGNLYVADTGNGRVVRFPAPFASGQASLLRANLVLGESSFTSAPVAGITGASNMGAPYGLAFFSDGSLAVSDRAINRVTVFRKPSGGDFTSFQAATVVIGQADFNSSQSVPLTSANYGLSAPAGLATDPSDRLYVADPGNSRVAIFTQVLTSAPGGFFAASVTGVNSPFGVTVNSTTGEMWVADTNNNQLKRFLPFTQFQFNQNPTAQLGSINPLAVTLDPFGNLIVAEAANRISFYFAMLTYQHAATYNQRPLAPGQLAYLYRLGLDFAFTAADGTQVSPWPTTLNDVQVTVNGIPAPIFHINPTRIDFQVPQSAPTSGPVPFVVSQVSTGAILAAATIQMAPTNPGFFTANAQGTGQVAAFNQDGSVNSPTNPILRGSVISFCLTGAGPVQGAPPDGAPPSAAAPTPTMPQLLSASFPQGLVPAADVQYSGLGCGFPGGWQINFQVPTQIPPGPNNAVALVYEDVSSNVGPTTQALVVTFSAK